MALKNVHLIEVTGTTKADFSYRILHQENQEDLEIKKGGILVVYTEETPKVVVTIELDKDNADGTSDRKNKKTIELPETGAVAFRIRNNKSHKDGHKVKIKCCDADGKCSLVAELGVALRAGGPIMKVEND